MKTSIRVNNGNNTRTFYKSSRSFDCCCTQLVEEIQSIKNRSSKFNKKMDQILLFLRENFSSASIIFDESQSDLIKFSEKNACNQKSSGHKWKTVLPESQFEVTDDSVCLPSSQIGNEIEDSFAICNFNHLQEKSVTTSHNEPKSDEIICEFDPLFDSHEPETFLKHGDDITPHEIEHSTFKASRYCNRLRTTTIEKILDILDDGNMEQSNFVRNQSQGVRTRGCLNKFKEYSVYNIHSGKRIDLNQVEDSIQRKWKLVKNQERTPIYICKIDHHCYKHFKSKSAVVNHIFSLFFVIQCRDCERNFNRIDSLSKHCKHKCPTKGPSEEASSKYSLPTEELNADEDLRFNGKKRLLYYSSSDEDLNCSPVVEILRLPDFMIESNLPASKLDQYYSILGKEALKKNTIGMKSSQYEGELEKRKGANETTINASPTNLKTRLRCEPTKRNFDGYLTTSLKSIDFDESCGASSITLKDTDDKEYDSVESNAYDSDEAEILNEQESDDDDDDPDYALDQDTVSNEETEISDEMFTEDEIDEMYNKVKRRLALLFSDDENSQIDPLHNEKSSEAQDPSQWDTNKIETLNKLLEDESENESMENLSYYKEPAPLSQPTDEPESIVSDKEDDSLIILSSDEEEEEAAVVFDKDDDCLIKLSDDEKELVEDMGIMSIDNLKATEKEKKKKAFIDRVDHSEDLLTLQQGTKVRHNGLSLEVSLKNHSGDSRCFCFNFVKDGEILNAPLVSTNLKIHMSKESGSTFDLDPGSFRCICDDCIKNNVSKVGHIDQLLDHLLRQRQIQFQCFYCVNCFTGRADLYNHIKNSHWSLGRVILKSYSFISPQSSKFNRKNF